MKKLGLIVNPIAGMGGRVGLKGTDGGDVYQRALSLGAEPQASRRAVEALSVIANANQDMVIVTCTGAMGEEAVRCCGLSSILLEGIPQNDRHTTAEDTRRAVHEMQRMGVDLLLFAGGDGTARDICDAMRAGDHSAVRIPALGIPAGVKMHSGVFALSPRKAGEIALRFLRGDPVEMAYLEVMDIDEEAFRAGRLFASLHGYLTVPQDSQGVQATKSGAAIGDNEAALDIAQQVISDMDEDALYIIGPGTTTAAIMDTLGISNTLLGIDVIQNKNLLASDTAERELLELTKNNPAKIVVTAIGGQGYIIGRGNQQLSPQLIRQVGVNNIIVVATRRKLLELGGRPLLVDTGDLNLDEELSGYMKVITGYRESHIYKVSF